MKKPFEAVTNTALESLKQTKEDNKIHFANLDSLLVWVVGFSIAGLSIIVADVTKFNQNFSHRNIKTVLILLVISIISGIVYRWFFYIYQQLYQIVINKLQTQFSDIQITATEPDDVAEIKDIREIIDLIRIDYGEDVSKMQAIYETSDHQKKIIILQSLKDHYLRIGRGAAKEYAFAIEYVKNTLVEELGASRKSIDKAYSGNLSMRLKTSLVVSRVALYITCLTFITVLIMLVVRY